MDFRWYPGWCEFPFPSPCETVLSQNQSEAEVKAEKMSQIDFNGMDKEVYTCATCDTHTKTYAQRHNYRIIEEDV